MKHLFTILFVSLLATLSAQNTWIVCNTPGFDANFTDLQTAINTAAAGDILLIQGSAASYGNATITKPLVFSGPGYFLNQNPQTQAQMGEAILDGLTIDNGGSGCIIEGLSIIGSIYLDSVSNVIIQSCRIDGYYSYIAANYSQNIIVKQCFLSNSINWSCGVNTCSSIIDNSGNSSFIIANNIINSAYCVQVNNSIVENNIFNSNGVNGIYNTCTVQSNIFISNAGYSQTNSSFYNNLSAAAIFGGNINGNQENVDMSTVFVGYPTQGGYSNDGRWQLKPNSPAIGAGVGGIDCGAWGGSAPYKLSGMSFNPNIWQVVMPVNGTSGGGLNVTVKANANQ